MNTRQRVPSPEQQVTTENAVARRELPLQMSMPRGGTVIEQRDQLKAYSPKMAKAILAITREIQPVQKAGENTFHKYMYAKWEDILEQLSPLIAKHGLIIMQNEVSHGQFEGVTMIAHTYDFTIINEDGDVWPDRPMITSICKIKDSKGMVDDKASSKCHTQAQKYMMTSMFKIRTADMADADADVDSQPRKRPVPSPSGHVAPHKVVGGETAKDWVDLFLPKIALAKTSDELDEWDKLNSVTIDRVQEKSIDDYNRLVDALNARHAAIAQQQQQQTTQNAANTTASQMLQEDGMPEALRRAKPQQQETEQEWLQGLDGAFSGCEDSISLGEEQNRLMAPWKDKASDAGWNRAVELMQANLQRIEALS